MGFNYNMIINDLDGLLDTESLNIIYIIIELLKIQLLS